MYTEAEKFIRDGVDPTLELRSIDKLTDEAIMAGFGAVSEDCEETLTNGNVVIAAFTTAGARLKLYSYMEKLGDRVIYTDTGKNGCLLFISMNVFI